VTEFSLNGGGSGSTGGVDSGSSVGVGGSSTMGGCGGGGRRKRRKIWSSITGPDMRADRTPAEEEEEELDND